MKESSFSECVFEGVDETILEAMSSIGRGLHTEVHMADTKRTPEEQEEFERNEALRKEAEDRQKKHEASIKFMEGLYNSNEGFAPRKDGDDLDYALAEGLVYMNAVQSGPGGLDVEERVFLTDKGYNILRDYHGNKALSRGDAKK